MKPNGSARKRRPMAQSGKVREAGPGFRKRSIRATGTLTTSLRGALATKQSIASAGKKDGLLRCARNDVERALDTRPQSRDAVRPRYAISFAPPKKEGRGESR